MTELVELDLSFPVMKNKAVDTIIYTLDNHPSDWTWNGDSYSHIVHATGISVWVYGGSAHLYHPRTINFGLINWFKLRRAFKRWKKAKGTQRKEDAEKDALECVIGNLRTFHLADD